MGGGENRATGLRQRMSAENSNSDEPISYVLRLRERAVRDINAAYVCFAEMVSEAVADEWRDGLTETLAGLASLPRRCPLAPERFQREVRQLLYRRPGSQVAYRVLFTITGKQAQSPDAPTIIILHVRPALARPVTRTQAREIDTEKWVYRAVKHCGGR